MSPPALNNIGHNLHVVRRCLVRKANLFRRTILGAMWFQLRLVFAAQAQ